MFLIIALFVRFLHFMIQLEVAQIAELNVNRGDQTFLNRSKSENALLIVDSNVEEIHSQDYDLKDLLLACIEHDKTDLFKNILEMDVKDWNNVPDVDVIAKAVASSDNSDICFYFLNDSKLNLLKVPLDPIWKPFVLTYNIDKIELLMESSLCIFDFENIYAFAEEIYQIQGLPDKIYRDALPSLKEIGIQPKAPRFMFHLVRNHAMSVEVLGYIINITRISLEAIDVTLEDGSSEVMTLASFAEFHQNFTMARILNESKRYKNYF